MSKQDSRSLRFGSVALWSLPLEAAILAMCFSAQAATRGDLFVSVFFACDKATSQAFSTWVEHLAESERHAKSNLQQFAMEQFALIVVGYFHLDSCLRTKKSVHKIWDLPLADTVLMKTEAKLHPTPQAMPSAKHRVPPHILP